MASPQYQATPPQQQQQVQINLKGGQNFQAISADEAIIDETNREVAQINSELEATAEAMRDIQELASKQGVQLNAVQEETAAADAQVQEGVETLNEIPCCQCCACWVCLMKSCGCC